MIRAWTLIRKRPEVSLEISGSADKMVVADAMRSGATAKMDPGDNRRKRMTQ